MANSPNSLMNETLTIEEYLQTRPDSVKELLATSSRILDTFTTLNYGKKFKEVVSDLSTLDRDSG